MAIIKVVKAGKTKASLKSALNYIANEEKITTITGKKLITPLNCWGSLKNIYDTMIATKELYRKAIDNRNSEMYKHFQQSFKPNEITPEKAHEIGKKWAMQNFAQDGFEVCICTHLDTEHIHNHFIINSVNAIVLMNYAENIIYQLLKEIYLLKIKIMNIICVKNIAFQENNLEI